MAARPAGQTPLPPIHEGANEKKDGTVTQRTLNETISLLKQAALFDKLDNCHTFTAKVECFKQETGAAPTNLSDTYREMTLTQMNPSTKQALSNKL